VRVSVVLLLLSLAGILGGAALIGVAALGGAVIFVSACTGVYTLFFRDDGTGRQQPQVHGVPTLGDVLERARRSA
jgi:hypothetical protein